MSLGLAPVEARETVVTRKESRPPNPGAPLPPSSSLISEKA